MKMSSHAAIRSKQRGVPPLMVDLLRLFGARDYDHHGGVIRYFDKRARKAAEKAVGSQVMRRLTEFLNLYAVESACDGSLITVGHRYKRIHRH
jgi:hypothetical protein